MEEGRAQFEAWMISRRWSVEREAQWEGDNEPEYLHERVQLQWEAWQASRQAIEISLPTEIQLKRIACSDCASGILDEVETHIHTAGLRIKGE